MLSMDLEVIVNEEDGIRTNYDYFKSEFEKLTGIQLNLYKEKQMKRRINTFIERKGLKDYESFLDLLKKNSDELSTFVDYITINVTEFFRTPEHWIVFEDIVLGDLLNHTNGKLKIWSCACSTGEEAYSLAISLAMLTDISNIQIIASDIDESVLKKAKLGHYEGHTIESLPLEIKEHFFTLDGSHGIVKDSIRHCVKFMKIDLLKDQYPMGCDLIVCRNVLIYFTDEAKEKIYKKFQKSLKTGGYLFTGNTEQIIYYKKYGLKKLKKYLYQNN